MRTPSGIRLNLTLVQFLLADKDHSLPDPTSEKLVRDCIIPAIKKMKEYPGLAEALQSKHGMDFYDTNSTQIFLDNIPTQWAYLVSRISGHVEVNIDNHSTFNVEMKRKTHQRQKNRSSIWDAIFTYPSSQHPAQEHLTHSMTFTYPVHPPLQEATVIQTNLKLSPSAHSPCNPHNRKKWTAKERKKASGGKCAKARGFLNDVCPFKFNGLTSHHSLPSYSLSLAQRTS